MADVFLYAGEPNPKDIVLADPTTTRLITGTASVSFAAASIDASGAETFAGTASETFAGPALDAASAETFTGAAAETFAGPAIAGTGAETFAATAAQAFAAPDIAATGAESFTGAADLTFAAPAIDAVGTAVPAASGAAGTMAATLAAPDLAGAGTVVVASSGLSFGGGGFHGLATFSSKTERPLAAVAGRGAVAATTPSVAATGAVANPVTGVGGASFAVAAQAIGKHQVHITGRGHMAASASAVSAGFVDRTAIEEAEILALIAAMDDELCHV